MPISMTCAGCGQKFRVDESLAGRRGKCKRCGQGFVVSAPDPVVAAPAPAPAATPASPEAAPAPSGGRWFFFGMAALSVVVLVVGAIWPRRGAPEAPALAPMVEQPDPVPRAAPDPVPRAAPAVVRPDPPSAPAVLAPPVGEIRAFAGHAGGIDCVEASPSGRLAFSGGDGKERTLRLWEIETGREVRRFEGDAPGAACAAFSPDGSRVLAGGSDNRLRLWDVTTGREIRRFEGHTNHVNHLVFTPDGRRAASTSWDQTVRLWDVETGREVRRFEGHKGSVNGLACTPDGRSLISGGADHTVRIWEIETGRELRRFEGHSDWVGDLAISPDGRTVASGGGMGEPIVLVWDVETLRERGRFSNAPDAGWSIVFTKDGLRLLSVEFDAIVLRDLADGREIHRYRGPSGQVRHVAVLPDGRRFLSAGEDAKIRLWGLPPAAPAAPTIAAREASPTSAPATSKSPPTPKEPGVDVLFRRARELLSRLGDAPGPAAWARVKQEFIATARAAREAFPEVPLAVGEAPGRFHRVALNARRLGFDGIRFRTPAGASAWDLSWEFVVPRLGEASAIRYYHIVPVVGEIRDYGPSEIERDEKVEGIDLAQNVHVSQRFERGWIKPETEYILWFDYVDAAPEVPTYVKIRLRPTSAEALAAAHFEAQEHRIELPDLASGMAFLPDGRRARIACGSSLLTIDVETGRIAGRVEVSAANVSCATFTRDGRLAAVGSEDRTIRIVEAENGREVRVLRGHEGPIRCLAFARDGRTLASGAEDRTARIWEVDTGRERRKLEGHTDQVLALDVSPDGRRLATGASIQDPVGRVWDTATGSVVCRLEGNAEAIYAIAFAPDGRSVLTGGEDDEIRAFDARTGRLLSTFDTDEDANVYALAFLPDGVRALSASHGPRLHLWDARSGEELASFQGHLQAIKQIAVAPDGRRALTASNDLTARIWRLPPGASRPRGRGR